MKNRYYRFNTAIWLIDFHRFPLSIDKNHLIAIDFYRLTTPAFILPWNLLQSLFQAAR